MTELAVDDHPLLAPLDEEERARVKALGAHTTASAGERLATQGTPASHLHLLLAGQVRVERSDELGRHELAVLGPGAWVGEGALLGRDATADVIVTEDVRSFALPAESGADALAVTGVDVQLDTLARRRGATHRAIALPPLPLGIVYDALVELRPVWPDDWRLLDAGRGAVSQESLAKRFFTVPPMTERTFRRFADVDFRDQFAWAVLVDGQLAAIGRYALQVEDHGVAEIALLVADELQGYGLGRILVAALAAAASVHGARELSAIARDDNERVHRLLTHFGASWSAPTDGIVTARWPVEAAVRSDAARGVSAAAGDIARVVLFDVADG